MTRWYSIVLVHSCFLRCPGMNPSKVGTALGFGWWATQRQTDSNPEYSSVSERVPHGVNIGALRAMFSQYFTCLLYLLQHFACCLYPLPHSNAIQPRSHKFIQQTRFVYGLEAWVSCNLFPGACLLVTRSVLLHAWWAIHKVCSPISPTPPPSVALVGYAYVDHGCPTSQTLSQLRLLVIV